MEINFVKNRKIQIATVLLCSLALVGAYSVASFEQSVLIEAPSYNGSIVGLVIGALVGVIVASALLPTIANNTATLETDTAGDLDTNEESLVGTWVLLIIIGVMMAIIAMAL